MVALYEIAIYRLALLGGARGNRVWHLWDLAIRSNLHPSILGSITYQISSIGLDAAVIVSAAVTFVVILAGLFARFGGSPASRLRSSF